MVVVADSSFAALNCCGHCQMSRPVHIITRLRLDAQPPAPLRRSKQMGRPRKVGKRLPGLKALVNNPYPLADSGDEGLVWSGDSPARHLSNRSLVQNWDASRAHSLGLD